MNEEKDIPDKYFITKNKKIIKYVPEKDVKIENIVSKKEFEKLFPSTEKNIEYKKLLITNIARYSMANRFISNEMEKVLKKYIPLYLKSKNLKKFTITETNGGVGGLSLMLSKWFNKINIIEINPIHSEIIKNNLSVYNVNKKNINILNQDYLDVVYDLNQDIIISDPPWGGYNYKKYKYMKLGLNNINISYIIQKLYKLNKFKMFILIAMKNFDLSNLINNIDARSLIIENLGKHYFIIILGQKYIN